MTSSIKKILQTTFFVQETLMEYACSDVGTRSDELERRLLSEVKTLVKQIAALDEE